MTKKSYIKQKVLLPPSLIADWVNTFESAERPRVSKIFFEILPIFNYDLDRMKGHKDYQLAVTLTTEFVEFFHQKCQEQLPSGQILCGVTVPE
jgi:hypothetical protein